MFLSDYMVNFWLTKTFGSTAFTLCKTTHFAVLMVMRIMTSRFPGCSEYHIFLKTEFDIVCAMFACLIILV